MPATQNVTIVVPPATSVAVAASASATGNSAVFIPQLGRDMYLTLSGTWVGTVQVQRSTDAGATWRDITIGGGNVWGRYTANCDEEVATPTDNAARYRLAITLSSGTLAYRLSQ